MAKDLVSKGILSISQLWDSDSSSWYPATTFFPLATQRTRTTYSRLISQLRHPSTYSPVNSPFQLFSLNNQTYIFNSSDPSCPSLLSVDLHHQHLLRPTQASFPLPPTSSSALISEHRAYLVKSPQLHDYSQVPYIFHPLPLANLPSGLTLPCATSADFCKVLSSTTDLVAQRLERGPLLQDLTHLII
jgi:hypothetical protein